MRKTSLVGLFVLACAVAGVTACGSNSSKSKKADDKSSAGQTAAAGVPQAVSTPEVTPVAVREVTGTPGSLPLVSDKDAKARYTLVLGEGGGGFALNAKTLSAEAKAKIDEMFTGTQVDLKGAHFLIEGHTDNLGKKEVNERIGLARAEAVRQYICEKYQIPLELVDVASFGFDKPVADNATDEGRALNRRVVIRVLD